MLLTHKQNRNIRTISESNVIHSRKTSYKRLALESTIDIATNACIVERVLGRRNYLQKNLQKMSEEHGNIPQHMWMQF